MKIIIIQEYISKIVFMNLCQFMLNLQERLCSEMFLRLSAVNALQETYILCAIQFIIYIIDTSKYIWCSVIS